MNKKGNIMSNFRANKDTSSQNSAGMTAFKKSPYQFALSQLCNIRVATNKLLDTESDEGNKKIITDRLLLIDNTILYLKFMNYFMVSEKVKQQLINCLMGNNNNSWDDNNRNFSENSLINSLLLESEALNTFWKYVAELSDEQEKKNYMLLLFVFSALITALCLLIATFSFVFALYPVGGIFAVIAIFAFPYETFGRLCVKSKVEIVKNEIKTTINQQEQNTNSGFFTTTNEEEKSLANKVKEIFNQQNNRN